MAAAPAVRPPKRKVTLYRPHSGQVPFHKSKARFRVATCGRRWGKTLAAANEAVKWALSKPEYIVWWVAPVYQQTEKGYREVIRVLRRAGIKFKEKKSLGRIMLNQGSHIEFHTATNFDNLRGEGVDLLIIDEAAMVAEEAWNDALRPTLTDKQGRAIFISTPKGKTWFYKIWRKGQKHDPDYDPAYESWKFPTAANPYIPPEEIEAVKKELPSDSYKQEYLAEFLEESAGVFRGIRKCVAETLRNPVSGHSYVLGWDPAKSNDFSVVVVMDKRTRDVVYIDRFNQIDYNLQLARIEAIAKRYHARILMDATGVGDPIMDAAKKVGLSVEGFMFSGKSKQQLIEALVLAIERQNLHFPDDKNLIEELTQYEYAVTKNRNITYGAPEGYHDDMVSALALANWMCRGSRMFENLGNQIRAVEGSASVVTEYPQPISAKKDMQKGWRFDPVTRQIYYPDNRPTWGGRGVIQVPTGGRPGLGRFVPSGTAQDLVPGGVALTA